jgi:hypothetical protein
MLYHYIYKTSNDKGDYYIGRHSTKNLNDNYQGSGNWVKNSKNKNRILTTEILFFVDTFEELKDKELDLITSNIKNKKCKNQSISSSGFSVGEANPAKSQKERLRRSLSGGWFSTEEGKLYTKNNHPSDNLETKLRFRNNAIKQWENVEYKSYMSNRQRDFMNTPEQQKRMRENNPSFDPRVKEILKIKSKVSQDNLVSSGKHHWLSEQYKIDRIPLDKETSIRMTENNPMKNQETKDKVNYPTECPWCHKVGARRAMTMYHFDNCKEHPNYDKSTSPLFNTCIYCGEVNHKNVITRLHNLNCKQAPKLARL